MIFNFQKKYKNLLISLAIIGLWTALNFLFFYPSNTGLGKDFNVAIIFILTRNFGLALGLVVLLLRILRLLKSNNTVFYILIGLLNLSIGLLCVTLYFLKQADMPWLNKCLLNLLVGFLIFVDAFIFQKAK